MIFRTTFIRNWTKWKFLRQKRGKTDKKMEEALHTKSNTEYIIKAWEVPRFYQGILKKIQSKQAPIVNLHYSKPINTSESYQL